MKHLTATVRGLPLGTTAEQVEDHFNLSISSESPCIAGPVVEEIQGGTYSTTVTFQKEKKGRKRECEALKEHFNRGHFGGRQSTISVSDEFLGLNALAGRADAPVHVYFVHGLGGHAFKTWSSDVQDDNISTLKAWPRDFLPKRLSREGINARMYSLGYNANVVRKAAPNATIVSAAEDLLMRLRSDRGPKPPKDIYFVCHSLGGIVVCQALNMALFDDEDSPTKHEYRDIFIHEDVCLLKGVLLMGTPLRGSGQANIMAPIVKIAKGLNRLNAMNDNFLRALRENKDHLDVSDIVLRFKAIVTARKFPLLIACEETPYIGDSLTTSYESAVTIFKDVVIPFRIQGSDHLSMVKFEDPNEPEYQMLENLIVRMIREVQPEQTGRDLVHALPQQTSSPISIQPGGSSAIHWHNDYPEARDAPGINFFFNMANRQSTFGYPSRQQTDPSHYRPTRNEHPFPTSTQEIGHPNFQTRPFGRAQTQHASTDTNDQSPFNRLGLFDTALIIDDTGSMVKAARSDELNGDDRWAVTRQAVQRIAHIAARHDSNGIEIRFLKSNHLKGDNIQDGQAVSAILDQVDLWDGTHGGGTYFQFCLKDLIAPRIRAYQWYKEELVEYDKQLRQARRQRTPEPVEPVHPKPCNVIVITDGAADDRPEVEEYIVSIAEDLDRMCAPKRQIGIQFVQVGDDTGARVWLNHLDNELKERDPPIRDIVDTTPFDSHLIQSRPSLAQVLEEVLAGVIRKALLGGVTDEEDQRINETTLAELEI